jgi:RecA-family ATPase
VAVRLQDPIKEGPPDIIPGFLPRQGQLVVAGETNIGKSLVALEVLSALCTGAPLWGELKPTIKANKILYILGEHYNEIIQRLWQLTGLPINSNVWLIGPEKLGYDKWLVAMGKPNVSALAKLQKWADGADLIIFDPLAAFVMGIDAENDNVQMRLVLDTMSLVSQATGASCLILAHLGKPVMAQNGSEHSRRSYAIRGASAIEDAATNIFYMQRAEGTSHAAAETRDHKIFLLKCRKYKGSAPDEYRLMRNPNTLTHVLLGNRPFVEVRKMEIQAKVARVNGAFPKLRHAEVLRILAAAEGLSEATIRRYLNGEP